MPNYIYGTDESEFIMGTDGDDVIYGLGGDDYILPLAGNDWIDGGDGLQDTITYFASPSGVYVNLELGYALDGYGTTDTIINIEWIEGSYFDDILIGDANDNGFWLGLGGNNYVDGGEGYDQVLYMEATSGVTANLETGIATWGGWTDTLVSIEGFVGSSYDDFVTMSSADSFVWTGAGDDVVFGMGGNSAIAPGSGTDYVDGGGGFNSVDYSIGDFDHNEMLHGAHVNLKEEYALDPWGYTDTLKNIDGATGTNLDDVLIGNDNSNHLWGDGGDDLLIGGLGDDILVGGDGNDTFVDSGYLYVQGNPGKAVGHAMAKGKGHEKHANSDNPGHSKHDPANKSVLISDNDQYWGGHMEGGPSGDNLFIFGEINGHDIIWDFQAGEGSPDSIDISAWGYQDLDALFEIAREENGGTMFQRDDMNSLWLAGVSMSDLHSDDFIFA